MADSFLIDAPVVPDSHDIEIAILSGIMKTPYLFNVANKVLKADMFGTKDTRAVWKKYGDLDARRELNSTSEVLHRVGAEMVKQMMACMESPSTELEMVRACSLLKEVGIKRSAYFLSVELMKKAVDQTSSVDEILAFPETADKQLKDWEAEDARTMSIADAITALGDEIQATQEARKNGEYVRIPTGLPTLDYLTYSGWKGGNLVILAARPSVGKTALMLQMAKAAADHGCPAAIFNLEMTNTELAQRYVTSTGIMTQADIAEGRVQWNDFEAAMATFSRMSLFMNDSCRYIETIVPKIGSMVSNHGVRAVFIDYLQLIESAAFRGGDKAKDRIELITRRLKETAKDFNVPIILLSQLNRSSAAERRAPQLYDLRDSGSIEQDADIVLMLERASDQNGNYRDDELDLWIRKNRQGKGGNLCINLKAFAGYTVFAEADSLESQALDLPAFTTNSNEPF